MKQNLQLELGLLKNEINELNLNDLDYAQAGLECVNEKLTNLIKKIELVKEVESIKKRWFELNDESNLYLEEPKKETKTPKGRRGFTDLDLWKIRTSKKTNKQLGKEYNVSATSIGAIRNRRTYANRV